MKPPMIYLIIKEYSFWDKQNWIVCWIGEYEIRASKKAWLIKLLNADALICIITKTKDTTRLIKY